MMFDLLAWNNCYFPTSIKLADHCSSCNYQSSYYSLKNNTLQTKGNYLPAQEIFTRRRGSPLPSCDYLASCVIDLVIKADFPIK